jgi:hypothetical protein
MAASPKKFFDFGHAIALRCAPLRPPGPANARACANLLAIQKIFRLRQSRQPERDRDVDPAGKHENASLDGKPPASVDKPMNIHRIECAKPRDLATSVFLSSFGPRQTQALFSSLKRR